MKEDLTVISGQVPEDEGETVSVLTGSIRALNRKIEHTRTMDKRLLLDENNKKMVIDGKACEVLPISVKIKGSYEELINLLSSFRKSIPAHISVVRMLIEAPKDDTD